MTSTFLPMDKSHRASFWILTTVRAALAIGVCLLLAVQLPNPLHAQGEVDVSACSNGKTVPYPEDTPGLVRDCETLLGIKQKYPGFASLPWWTSDYIYKWDGVSLRGGRVTGLNLVERGLEGPIPTELSNLSSLTFLSLKRNRLTGAIPPELGKLDKLETLILGANQLTGILPAELGLLGKLRDMIIRDNELTGIIPPELGRLNSLKRLLLKDNHLTGKIPGELGNLANLESLEIADNQLTGSIPSELSRLANLKGLALNGNQLTGYIPPELGNLSRLKYLALSGNRLTGIIPPELGNLVSLERLVLSDNLIEGPIPAELGNLPELDALEIMPGNSLCGPIPEPLRYALGAFGETDLAPCGPGFAVTSTPTPNPDSVPSLDGDAYESVCTKGRAVFNPAATPGLIKDCATLLRIKQEYPGFSGVNWSPDIVISNWDGVEVRGNPSRVAELLLGGRQITIAKSPETGKLETDTLYDTRSSDYELKGPIPPELGNLAVLKGLGLGNQEWTGPIPPELGKLNNLVWMDLSYSQLTGPIPPELGKLNNLVWMDLSYSQLTGPIPPELGKLNTLVWMYFRNNKLTGPIPAELSSLADLEILELGNNQLTGFIPAELGDLDNLELLALFNNQLTGPIPAELGDLVNLQGLRLGVNQLTGAIPPELGKLSNLVWMNVSYNRLTGPIPPELGELDFLNSLYISENELCGTIPERLQNLDDRDFRGFEMGPCDPQPQPTVDTINISGCSNGLAVTNPADNAGLVEDCRTLLTIKSTQRGAAILNWSPDIAMSRWNGVKIEGAPLRVTKLDLEGYGLAGEISEEFGRLAGLVWLDLSDNLLTGVLPDELGDLSILQALYVTGNQVCGEIPEKLWDVHFGDEQTTVLDRTGQIVRKYPGTDPDYWSCDTTTQPPTPTLDPTLTTVPVPAPTATPTPEPTLTPRAVPAPTPTPTITVEPPDTASGATGPSTVVIVLAVIGGLLVIVAIGTVTLWVRRHKETR